MKKRVVVSGKTYEEYELVVHGDTRKVTGGGKLMVYPNVKRITVTDYQDIVIIDGKLFTEVKKK